MINRTKILNIKKTTAGLVLTIPASVAKEINLTDAKDIHYSVLSGVLQITGETPHVAIPAMPLVANAFLPQPKIESLVTKSNDDVTF